MFAGMDLPMAGLAEVDNLDGLIVFLREAECGLIGPRYRAAGCYRGLYLRAVVEGDVYFGR